MKKFIIVLILVGAVIMTFAQEYQVIDTTKYVCTYNYEFLEDSSSMYSLAHSVMYLQIGSHLSKFTSLSTFISDSIFSVNKKNDTSVDYQVIKAIGGTPAKILADFTICKNWPQKDGVSFIAYDDHKFYQVIQPLATRWELLSAKDSVITGYQCKMATTTFAGRKYIAWYTMQVPVSDGPYKFNGLPGLIVKISDTRNEHRFTLTSVKKIKYIQPIVISKHSYFTISPQQHVKILKNKINRLSGSVQNGNITLTSEEGKARSLRRLKATNNFIEKY